MKTTLKTLFVIIVAIIAASDISFAARKAAKSYAGNCNSENSDVWYVFKTFVDDDADGKWDHYWIKRCDGSVDYKKMNKPVGVIEVGGGSTIDPSNAPIRQDLKFDVETLLPSGMKVQRAVMTWQDTVQGEVGIEYQSIVKDANNEVLSFFTETKIPNPFNAGWTFADVHGQLFSDAVRGTLVNELYENGTNKLVGIQYFPNGGNAVTIFFYPKQ